MLKKTGVSIVIITGGLGPTADDQTRQLIADTFSKPLVYNSIYEDKIKVWFQKRKIPYLDTNKIQACFPEGAIVLDNPVGSAPGFQMDDGDFHLFCFPGVPSEMKTMFQTHLVPWLQTKKTVTWYNKDLRLFGLSESALEALLRTFSFEDGVYWSSLPMKDCLVFRIYTCKSEEALNKATQLFVGALGEKTTIRGLNRATQSVRQTGSSMKPLADLIPGIDKGIINPATVYNDNYTVFSGEYAGKKYTPKNYNGYKGYRTLRQATTTSQNIPFVKAMVEITPPVARDYLRKMGISTLSDTGDNGLSLAIGGLYTGVSTLEMSAAYATIANDGVYREPLFYTKVEDGDGKVVLKAKQETLFSL